MCGATPRNRTEDLNVKVCKEATDGVSAYLIGWRKLFSRETLCGRLQRPLVFAECHAQARSSQRRNLLANLTALFHVAAEIGLALLVEGANALTQFFGPIIKVERLHPHRCDATDMVRVGIERRIERTLGDRDGGGAALQDLRAPASNFRIQLVVRHHCIASPIN